MIENKTIDNEAGVEVESEFDKPPPLSSFTNPYPKDSHERIQLWIGSTDVNFIRLIRPQIGTFSAVGGHLWLKLCTALRNNNIKDFTQSSEFEQFILNSTIISNEEYESIKNDAIQWRQYQAARGKLVSNIDRGSSGGDKGNVETDGNVGNIGRPSPRAKSHSNERNVRKRTQSIRPVHPDE